uniref:hypothetical protein n=4 Tax=Roseivirga sp. TaxID=1964215 RepID=UPI0040477D90
MSNTERPKSSEEGKLRRWVANLQLESWQLELLITGFSIFLLASGLEEYNTFNNNFKETKIINGANGANPLINDSIKFILNTIPIGLKFFLINLLIHLLLRGFWIGIVGLSSVSSKIDFESLNFKGKFRRFIPENVKSLDELILYLDKISSVVFAYTFLLVFSIISVVIVFSIGLSTMGVAVASMMNPDSSGLVLGLSVFLVLIVLFYFFMSLIFFLDTLLFSYFKKSRWFSTVYYPFYRFFSFISFAFIYRSIYYHLITNFKKKYIIGFTLVLLAITYTFREVGRMDLDKYYPEYTDKSELMMAEVFYDDLRLDHQYIRTASIPSKYVDNGFLELFIRYNPNNNSILKLICPDAFEMKYRPSVLIGFKEGMKADSVIEAMTNNEEYDKRLLASIACQTSMFEVYVDGELQSDLDYSFKQHAAHQEKGYLTIIDVAQLGRGKHVIELKGLVASRTSIMREVTKEDLSMKTKAKISFWIE